MRFLALPLVVLAMSGALGIVDAPVGRGFGAREASDPLVIVVNRANTTDAVSTAELRRLFRGQRSHWANGRRVTLLMRDVGTPERGSFLEILYGMDEEEYRREILQAIFAGQANGAPRTLSSANGVLRFVFNAPGAVGYVRASEVDGTVKVLRVDGKLPTDEGYPLAAPSR